MGLLWKRHGGLNDYTDQVLNILQHNLTRVVDNFVDTKFPAVKNGLMAWRPHIDLKETDKEYILKADIPGVEKKDIKIELHDHVLSIKGERKVDIKKDEGMHHWMERFHGKFMRSFSLPEDAIDQQKIDAEFENGVLTISLKKKQSKSRKDKPAVKNIDIK